MAVLPRNRRISWLCVSEGSIRRGQYRRLVRQTGRCDAADRGRGNRLALWDTFANTDLTGESQLGEDLPQLAFAIGECWQGVLSARYPDRAVTAEVSDEEDGAYGPAITFWTEVADQPTDA